MDAKMDIHEQIKATTPEPHYMYLADDIVRDYAQHGRQRLYEDKHNSCDVIVYQTQKQVDDASKDIETHTLNLQRIAAATDASRLDEKDPDYKPLTKKQQKENDAAYATSIDALSEAKELFGFYTPLLDKYKWFQYMENWQESHMRALKFRYWNDRNLDYLQRGVTWVTQENQRMRRYFMTDKEKADDIDRDARRKHRVLNDMSAW
jgi:hypothetical protein